jgi:hypothetical protein
MAAVRSMTRSRCRAGKHLAPASATLALEFLVLSQVVLCEAANCLVGMSKQQEEPLEYEQGQVEEQQPETLE